MKDKDNKVTDVNVYDLSDYDFTISQLSGTDALGRKVSPTSGNDEEKFVSLYFFVWFGTHTTKVYDIGKLLDEYENGIRGNLTNPLWATEGEYYNSQVSPNGEFHYWGEPLFGYYDASDPWVIRKQLELLSYAQIDCLLMDFTNNIIYPEATRAILDIIKEMQKNGLKPPRVAFMLNPIDKNGFSDELKRVYDEYLSDGKYDDCFFIGNKKINPSGLPLAVGRNEITEKSYGAEKHFWIKTLQWHGYDVDAENFPAMSEEVKQVNHNGYMSVTTEVYSSANDIRNIAWCSDPYLYPDLDLMRGRGWTPGDTTNGTDPQKVLQGACFQNQWNNVFADSSVNFVHVQTWNEWWAQKYSYTKPFYDTQRAVFVDTFNEPFSRDIEPVNGRLGDNYYMQLVENVRRFKQISAGSAVKHEKTTIDITKGFDPWKDIKGNYLDLEGEIIKRNFKSVDPTIIYTNDSARNDLVRLKFANDDKNLYVMAETADNITHYLKGDDSWMNLYISTGETGGWENYNYIINRNPSDGETSIEKFIGSTLKVAGKVKYSVRDNKIFYSIPLEALGVRSGDQIEIKAADNARGFSNINEFYISGDCAPVGRLNYAYLLA